MLVIQNNRRLVPRWRSYDQTIRSGELGAARAAREGQWEVSPELKRRLERWRYKPSLNTAAELVEAAIVDGREGAAVNAARRLLFMERTAAPMVKRQAAALLQRAGETFEIPKDFQPQPRTVRDWRQQLRLHPRDALAWVEAALHATITGNLQRAERAMSVARSLAPDNRHVLRSAARLYLHLKDPERAYDTIARSAATRSDPWLLAAEISLAGLAERKPKLVRPGQALLDDGGLYPNQLTELAGSLATLHLIDGDRRKAKKRFQKSLLSPTGNALAQAQWAAAVLDAPQLVKEQKFEQVQEACEAWTLRLVNDDRLDEVPNACRGWAKQDPFSVRPWEFGASTSALSEMYEEADVLAGEGLKARPGYPSLVNTRAFALASANHLDEAERALKTMVAPEAKDLMIREANRGLIAFRRGEIAEAQTRYRHAIDGFRRLSLPMFEATAKIYLARESRRAGLEDAAKLVAEAGRAWQQCSAAVHPELSRLKAGLPPETKMHGGKRSAGPPILKATKGAPWYRTSEFARGRQSLQRR